MLVIVCKIPAKTSLGELLEFALSCFNSWLPFQKGPEVNRYEILEILDGETNDLEYHGLINFQHAKDAEKAIKRLNGKKLRGSIVTVREYVHRSPGDRRVNKRTQGLNRPDERRRTSLQITERSKSPKAKAYADMAKKHGN